MTKDEAIDIVRDAGFGYLATLDGDQPRVRPMMPYLSEDGKLLLALLGRSRTLNQIKDNAKVEVCFVDRKMWYCRVTGTAVISSDIAHKEAVWDAIPMLRQYFSGPADPNFHLAVIDIDHMEAMTPHGREPEKISLK